MQQGGSLITRKTLRGPAGGKKKIIGNDKMSIETAITFMTMDFDLGFSVIEITDTHILLEYYEGANYTMGTHKRYEGDLRHMKKLTHFVRARETILGAAA